MGGVEDGGKSKKIGRVEDQKMGIKDGGKPKKNGWRQRWWETQAHIIDGASVFRPQTTNKTNAIARRTFGGKPTDGND
ncbi:Hypothetical predicted protein [Olea europaea subsp. europaea]|uniref:Uncharacterized protein n=1 Tax=Olea europaea subsp. europaea TaxID=158383 RepID=A0A8S0UIF7_OLEEU|nr:Hypothetical predicted protein [Olea europaea subsp. europaea]